MGKNIHRTIPPIIMPRKGNAFPQLLFDGAAGSATGSGVDTLTFIKFN